MKTKAYYDGLNDEYPQYFWYLVAATVAFLAVIRWSRVAWTYFFGRRRLASLRSARTASEVEAGDASTLLGKAPSPGFVDFVVAIVRKYGSYATLPFLRTVAGPREFSVSETFVCVSHAVVVLVLTFINAPEHDWSDRAGIMAFSQIPLIIGLAQKNSVISWFTGVSYEKLNVLHRSAARMTFILAWVHTGGKLTYEHDQLYTTMGHYGATAVSLFTVLVVVSLRPVRARFYEFFFSMHVLLIITIIGVLLAHRPNHAPWLYSGFIIWGFDRLCRLVRLVVVNGLHRFHKSRASNASVELIAEDTVRLTVHKPMSMTWLPGSHAFISAPELSAYLPEGHPFTIASIPEPLDDRDDEDEKKGAEVPEVTERKLVFIIRGREGFTKRLLQRASNEKGKQNLAVFVDGPYSAPDPIHYFDNVLLVAGGSGISFTLPMLLDLVRRTRTAETTVRKIHFLWVVRQQAHSSWVASDLQKAISLAPKDLLSVRIHYTQAKAATTTPTDQRTLVGSTRPFDNAAPAISGDGVTFVQGRPDMAKLLEEVVDEANEGSLSVSASGPSALMQSVASETRRLISPCKVLKGDASRNLQLHLEAFGW